LDLPFLTFSAAALFLYALFSKRLKSTPISGPMVFVTLGVLGYATGFLTGVPVVETGIKDLLEITLALLLFNDASKLHFHSWHEDAELPTRLLAIGMPLTIVLGTAIGVLLFPTLGLIGAAIVATILAPTDAALGQAVVSNPIVPSRIRAALGVESGLNDGIALPILLFLISLYAADRGLPLWHLFFQGIGVAVAVGIGVGALTAYAIRIAARRGWIADSWIQISVVAVAFGTYVIADALGGSGFIAAYVAGHVFGTIGESSTHTSEELGDNIGTLLTMVSFLIFGAFILGPHPEMFTVRTVLFGVLSLTVIRMIPVGISMIGSHTRTPTRLYLGWFGPRGLASIIFAGVLVETSTIDSGTSNAIVAAVMVTVALSVFLHGATAPWAAERYGAWARSSEATDD
jgi:NhaP-type Na+/H+ or K+/H+ antiporter